MKNVDTLTLQYAVLLGNSINAKAKLCKMWTLLPSLDLNPFIVLVFIHPGPPTRLYSTHSHYLVKYLCPVFCFIEHLFILMVSLSDIQSYCLID